MAEIVKAKRVKGLREKCGSAKQYARNYKKTHPCIICGEERHYCLVFHHNTLDKRAHGRRGVSEIGRLEDVKKEISQCIVLCANCHLAIHYG